MKKLLAVMMPLALVATTVVTDEAKNIPLFKKPPSKFFATTIKGTITVPTTGPEAPSATELPNFGCGNIHVYASSVETKGTGGFYNPPMWTRSATATGNYASKSCSYSINVPAGSDFYLDTGAGGNYQCDVISAWIGPKGAAIGPYKVPFGQTLTKNFTISRVVCKNIT